MILEPARVIYSRYNLGCCKNSNLIYTILHFTLIRLYSAHANEAGRN